MKRSAPLVTAPFIQTGISGYPQGTILILTDSPHLVVIQAVGVLGVMLKPSEIAGRNIKMTEALLRTDPQATIRILMQGAYAVVYQTIQFCGIMLIAMEGMVTAIESRQPIVGGDPQHAIPVFSDRFHLVVRQTRSILGVMPIMDKTSIRSIHPVETAAIRSYPVYALFILKDDADPVATQA